MDGLGKAKDYPLSDSDIKKILGGKTSIMTYPMLGDLDDIDQCFDRKGRCILLFLTTSPQEGHWVCMIRRPDSIEYFDPYGESPAEMKENIPPSLLASLDQRQPYLSALFKKKGLPVYYNTHSFQQDKNRINTCGRHCVVRCLFSDYPLQKYYDTIKKTGLSADDFVVGKTYDILKK